MVGKSRAADFCAKITLCFFILKCIKKDENLFIARSKVWGGGALFNSKH